MQVLGYLVIRNLFLYTLVFSLMIARSQDNPYAIFGHKTIEYRDIPTSKSYKINDKNKFNSLSYLAKEQTILLLDSSDKVIQSLFIKPHQIIQFVGIDPMFKEYPSLSPYSFVSNNPLNNIDPDGRKILFVNGHYQSNVLGYVIGSRFPLRPYWSKYFPAYAQHFFKDYRKIDETNFINGSSKWGGDMSGQDRYEAGYEYAKNNLKAITSNMVEGETFKMVTHSEGSAYGAGVAEYLIEQGYKVETVLHLSADEGDEFKTPEEPMTYQLSLEKDWVTGNKPIEGVDKMGIALSDLGYTGAHGSTRVGGFVFKFAEDLRSVKTIDLYDIRDGVEYFWKAQDSNSTVNKSNFTVINQDIIMNLDGSSKKP